MSQTTHQVIEVGNVPHGDPQSATNPPLQGESKFGDSSGLLFSLYSKAAEEEDNKMVERWQKDADGILIFTGLFAAAVAALLTVTVQDLKPNSQDTSAFYLGNIYEVLADPNLTRASSPVAKPRPFSAPRYAVWVNSLWFLSLVMSVGCALMATSLQQWARRYIRLTQPARCSPEKHARMRAYFSNGADKMHIPWAVEGLPTLLHLSLFLFFGGQAIFLFNINHEVFTCVVWWIGLFSIVYGLVTMLPLIWHDSPYYTPLSIPAWFPYASIHYVTFKVLAYISDRYGRSETLERYWDLTNRYRRGMSRSVEKVAKEKASEQSSEIDVRILDWTMSALGDDDLLEKFFQAIPGFFNSKMVPNLKDHIPDILWYRLSGELDGLLDRTLSSNSVTDSVKLCRLDIYMNAVNLMREDCDLSLRHTTQYVQYTVMKALATVRERDDRWVELAARVSDVPERDLRDNIAHGGDNVLLAIVMDVSRRAIHSHELTQLKLLEALTEFDIRNTIPGLQYNFCTMWNELIQEARNRGPFSEPVQTLYLIRPLYVSLHQGTDAVPTAFSALSDISSPASPSALMEPSSYPLCDIASHRPRPDSTAHVPVPNSRTAPLLTQPGDSPNALPHHSASGSITASRQVNEAGVIAGPPPPSDPTTLSEIGGNSQISGPTSSALPAYSSLRPSDASPPAQRDIVAPCAELDTSEILSTASTSEPTSTVAPVPASASPVPINSLASYEGAPSLQASSNVAFAIPASPPSPHVLLLHNAEFPALFSSAEPSPPISNATQLPLRARGLINTGSMCFANSVLQLLVRSPPFWNLFREMGGSKGQRGAGNPEIDGGVTPLVDATVKFFEEFMFKEEPPPTQQPTQQVAGGNLSEDEDAKKEHNAVDSFKPVYMYDAMKEKRPLKDLLDGQQQDAEEFFRLYLEALDEELLTLHASISGHKSTTAVPGVEEGEVSKSGQTEVWKRGNTVQYESPLMRIFGGKFRSTVRAPNQPEAVSVECWRSLQLDIQHDSVHDIDDALAFNSLEHLLPEQLGPSGLRNASKQVLIEVLPPILVLHLKRFLHDVAAGGTIKISKPVRIAPELEIPLEIMAPVAGSFIDPVHYKLYGVLYHHGESAGGGHYTVDVLHPNRDSGSGEAWLHIDDESLSTMRQEGVFGGHDNELMDDRCAYMLFYCRTAPAWT